MATFATAFPTTAPTTPNASTSLKRRMSSHAPTWPEYDAPVSSIMMMHQQQHQQNQQQQTLQQPSFKRVRLSHNSPGELCLQRDLKALTHSHQWSYQPHHGGGGCWVYEQDPKIRLHKSNSNSMLSMGEQQELLLEFSQDANITIQIPRMYPHETPSVTNIQGLWMDSILIQSLQQQQQQNNLGGGTTTFFQNTPAASAATTNATVVTFDHWSPIVHLSTLLEFCISHAKMHPTFAHAKMPCHEEYCLGERSTNTLHHHQQHQQQQQHGAKTYHHHFRQQQQQGAPNSENHHQMMMMEVSHPCKYTSPFAPNRMDVGYNKQICHITGQLLLQQQQQQQPPSQDPMEM
mmetsp:Transcript_31425/g.75779  ORF Transcript_31425/g.75779 Transcript_31425/m.75779 type:complete len:347 (-) Transcript_31425:27-1067(-)